MCYEMTLLQNMNMGKDFSSCTSETFMSLKLFLRLQCLVLGNGNVDTIHFLWMDKLTFFQATRDPPFCRE